MSIGSDLIRGSTDLILLTQLEEKDNYGYEINRTIQEATYGAYEFKEATLYTAFHRLEAQGLIESYWGDEQTGARRKYYHITERGKVMNRQLKHEWEEATEVIAGLIKSGLTIQDKEGNS